MMKKRNIMYLRVSIHVRGVGNSMWRLAPVTIQHSPVNGAGIK